MKKTQILSVLFLLTAWVLHAGPPASETVSFSFVGDIILCDKYPSAELPRSEGRHLFESARKYLHQTDFAFAGLGHVLFDGDTSPQDWRNNSEALYLKAPQALSTWLKDAGFDVLDVGTAHIRDFGSEGVDSTLSALREAGITAVGLKGLCETSIVTKEGWTVGFCSFTSTAGGLGTGDLEMVAEYIGALDEACNTVVVSFRSGEDDAAIQDFAHSCVDAGADIVIGHCSDFVAGSEIYKDRFITYSLGIFCDPFKTNELSNRAMAPLVQLTLNRDGSFLKGNVVSFIQKTGHGPVLDRNDGAAQKMQSVADSVIPYNGISISSDGVIRTVPLGTINSTVDEMLEFASKYIGCRYSRGKTGPDRFDCSGFTTYVFARYGIHLQRTAQGQYTQGKEVKMQDVRRGDLVFFDTQRRVWPGHVGIVTEVLPDGNIKFIHASTSSGVTVNSLVGSTYYESRFVGIRRVVDER